MNKDFSEKRRHKRYETEAKVYCFIKYDLKTKVKFQIIDKIRQTFSPRKYFAISKNIGVEGIGILCDHDLPVGTLLKLEVYVPGVKKPILMQGEVRWSAMNSSYEESLRKMGLGRYEIGIKLSMVDDQPVEPTIHFEDRYQLEWSVVLESVLGSFRIEAQKRQTE